MSPTNRPGGRQKRTVSGGGNANRRGGGLGGGPVGGGTGGGFSGGGSGGSGGGRAGGGGGLLGILAAILIGKAASGSGGSRSGCLKRIVILALLLAGVWFLMRMYSGSGPFSGYDYDGSGETGGLTEISEPVSTSPPTVAPGSLSELIGSLNGGTAAVSTASDAAYHAHEPDYTVHEAARGRYTNLRGNGNDTATVLIYMCGADLESKSAMATYDLEEMVAANISDNVNILVETGGASKWQNSLVSNRTCQIYQVKSGGLKRLESDVGKKPMVDADTLTEFIRYGRQNFPADRYMLIMWDHGGGSISGYGYDELFTGSGTMALDAFDGALKAAGCKFDFIGFDACLMAGLETALVSEQYADYLIASEATEPGTGWYYTNWLTRLSQDASMSTVDIGKQIIDDFVKYSRQSAPQSSATLSLTDLAELSGTVPGAFKTFSIATSDLIAGDQYQLVADARSGARDFSSSKKINQIDLIHFAENLDTEESNALARALRGCVKYNRVGANLSHANGLSIYFPYNSLRSVSTAVATYQKIGVDDSYAKCITDFASMAAGGSVVSGGSGNPLGSLLGDSSGSLLGSLLEQAGGSSADSSSASSYGSADMVSALLETLLQSRDLSAVTGDADSSWVNRGLLGASKQYFTKTATAANFANLMLTEKNGRMVLALSEEQWSFVKTLEQNVFLDDGEGYIDLGLDTVMDWNEDGDLVMEYDGTWLSLNGQIVAYYFISRSNVDGGDAFTGRVPAMLNGERVNIILVFDEANPYGVVLGAQPDYKGTADTVAKGLIEIRRGDQIDFLCDYYAYDGTYSDAYYLGERMSATGEWVVGNATVGNDNYRMTYRLTDLYNAKYWTPAVTGQP